MAAFLSVLLGVACAQDRVPSTPIVPPVLDGPFTLAGRVVSTQTGSPVAGATVELGQVGTLALVTDALGRYRADGVPSGHVSVTISAPGHLTRQTSLDVGASRDAFDFDVIRDAPPFNLEFFRRFGRSSLDSPSLHQLNPWQQAPRFYVRTVTIDLGEPVDVQTLLATERLIRNTVPELSGGRWSAAEIVFGTADRPRENGWVNMLFVSTLEYIEVNFRKGIWGIASKGGTSGFAYMLYSSQTRSPETYSGACESAAIRIVEHELVHVMGFGHTYDLEQDFWTPDCSGAGRSVEAKHHAQIYYSRRPGNGDIDTDRNSLVVNALREETSIAVCTADHLGRGGR